MNKEQIDELLEILVNGGIDKLCSYLGLTEKPKMFDESEKIFKQKLEQLMYKIELGDYDYLKSFLDVEKYREKIITYLFAYSSKTKDMKELIENREKYSLEKEQIIVLIIGIKDLNYARECIDRRKELGLDGYYIAYMITEINDPEDILAKEYIKEYIDGNNRGGFDELNIATIIEGIEDLEYIKECIKKLNLESHILLNIVLKKDNSEHTLAKECIERYKEIRLGTDDKCYLMRVINDSKYTKECIERREEIGLDSNEVIRFIQIINDPEYIKECVERREEIGLNSIQAVAIIRNEGTAELAIDCLKDYKKLNIDSSMIADICGSLKAEDFLKNILDILENFKGEEFYEEFVKRYFGEVEFDRDKSPIIPEDLKAIVFNVEDEEKAQKIKENLPQIIAKLDQIKEQIQYKKANSIKNDGLEIKFSIDEILLALQVLNKRMPQTVSEVEFENTPGSDRVGVDTQYTAKPGVAVERAYELSRKMDKTNGEKKFPDFSVENEEMILKVLHPQDKSSILLGFDTHCCFRPNGNADNSGENEYSLVQYATTTPYGGVIRVDSKENDEVYMGTPILRSGNCLMFHSYESTCSDIKKAEQVNELLDEAAIKAIEESKGQIRIVFMTNLHTGLAKIDTGKRLTIGSYFKPYFEEEYKNYSDMYTNLDNRNVVLAINVDGKILTGEQIREWFEKECSGDEEVFKEKLGLELGKVEDTYEYPRRNVFHEIAIDNKPIVDKFSDRYKGLKEERNLIALFNKKKQLESKKELSKEDEESLRIIEEELEQYKKSAAYIEYSELSIKDIKKKLEANKEETLKVFSGEDIYIIAEVLGITREEIEQVIEDRVRAQQPKEDLETKESSKAKKLKSMIISQIKGNNNPELLKLISKIAREEVTEEELKTLQELGIETEEYEKVCIRKEITVDVEQIQSDRIRVQKERLLKDESVVEAIVADKIFGDVTQEEIDVQILEDLIKTVKSHIYDYYVSQDADGIITEAEKERINQKIHELNIDTMISQCIDNEFEQTGWIERISKEFGLDVKSEYNKISSNPAKLKSKVQKSKLEKLKSDITLGIRKEEKIEEIQETIGYSEEQGEKKEFERMVFGNNWFIGFGDGKPIIHINPDISELDKEDLKVALRKEIDKAKEGKKTISMVEMRKVVSEVSLDDKKIGIKIMEDMLKEIENGERE